ncbi:hypothetical protein MQE36_12075 [Zhouia spongiae]|uniref:Two component regulator three Y domain-containing protein n=1 Tax=Zhouia spongiae TaxID=2202721 RepID=A0ABY3YJ05_9FLAO|nr:two-component regulator propeller domain-containing protein [Zhouia spongiae]UNY97822.1 hypothetical protein MQE36_12075 [Zhouia spongiae]
MSFVRLSALFLFFILFSCKVTGQHIRFKYVNKDTGLYDNLIKSIVQDDKGTVWIATSLGVNKLDGNEVKKYSLSNGTAAVVNMLYEDSRRQLWAATEFGLYKYNSGTDRFDYWESIDPKLNEALKSDIFEILEADDGSLLIINSHGYVIRFSETNDFKTTFYSYKDTNGKRLYMKTMAKDADGNLWLGTNDGRLLQVSDNRLVTTGFAKTKNESAIQVIVFDDQNQLWIGTSGNGLFRFNPATRDYKHYYKSNNNDVSKSINDNIILSLYVDKQNNLWIGTDSGGLNLYQIDEDTFSYINSLAIPNYSIPDNSISYITQGYGDIIWVGTIHGGVSYFKNELVLNNISPVKLKFPKNDQQGSVVLKDKKGNLWVSAGRNGLRMYDPRSGRTKVFIDDPDSQTDLNGNIIISLFEDPKGRIWIGTYWNVLNIYDPEKDKFIAFPKQDHTRGTFAIEKDDEGRIWLGCNSGIYIYDTDLNLIKSIQKGGAEGLTSNTVKALYNDVKGDMWIGTRDGLNIYHKENDKFEKFFFDVDDSTSLSCDNIVSIAGNEDLSILIGTYGGALNVYSREKKNFKRIGADEGLNGEIIRGINIDNDKNAWLSTNSGLSKISPDWQIENFDIEHGIHGFNGGKALLVNDTMYMGNSNGLTYFNPSKMVFDSLSPKIFITKLRLLENKTFEEIPFSVIANNEEEIPEVMMLPDNDLISVHFATSDYWTSEKNSFVFMLEGLNDNWQSIQKQNILTFANLAPGNYLLRIKVNPESNTEDVQEAMLKIVVKPSFFQMGVVRLGLLMFVFTGIIFLFVWRDRYIKAQRNRLEFLVKEKTKEIKRQEEEAFKKDLALLEAEKKNQELHRKRLREELNFKIEELTNYTLRTLQKNDLLIGIKEMLVKAKSNPKPQKIQTSAIVSMIDDSLRFDKDWEDFYTLFNQLHPTFIKSLKTQHPELSEREIKLCSLIKLKFTSQHIATLFGISLSSVKVARHRLRKKLYLSKDEDFETFFETFK